MNILLSDLLKKENPKHKIEHTMLISKYECGCKIIITFNEKLYNSNEKKTFNDVNLWDDSSHCNKNHSIDFKEIDECKVLSSKEVATEIFKFNSISVSSKIKRDFNNNLKINKGK